MQGSCNPANGCLDCRAALPPPQSLSWANAAVLNQTGGACNLTEVAEASCPEAPPGLDAWARDTLAWNKEQVLN